MTTLRQAAEMALEALEKLNATTSYWWQEVDNDIVDKLENSESTLSKALAEPQHQWVGLTDEERLECEVAASGNYFDLCRLIEATLKEKNT